MKWIRGLILLNCVLVALFISLKRACEPRVLIVPHHNVVQALRKEVIQTVAARRNKTTTIIVLSPDHFNPVPYHLLTTTSDWELTNGTLAYDGVRGREFEALLTPNDTALKNDHGVYNLLPELHEAFPQAKIIPILLGPYLTAKELDPLFHQLTRSCSNACLLVASVDFSHYLPAHLATVHDAYSLTALTSLNHQAIMKAEVDSPQSLYLAIRVATATQSPRFVLKAHTNSGALVNNYDLETTSHILGWYQRGLKNPYQAQTLVVATNVPKERYEEVLGERFFYGADTTITTLASPQRFVNLTVNPATSTSLIPSQDHLTINLNDNMVLAGIKAANTWHLVFLPLDAQEPAKPFLKGRAKQSVLENLLNTSTGLLTFPQ